MEKVDWEEITKIVRYNAKNYFKFKEEYFLQDALSLEDLEQEGMLCAVEMCNKLSSEEHDASFDKFKAIALAVGRKMNTLVKGATVNAVVGINYECPICYATSKKPKQCCGQQMTKEIESRRMGSEDTETQTQEQRLEGIGDCTARDDFFNTLSTELQFGFCAEGLLKKCLSGKDYEIAYRRIIEQKSDKVIAQELGHKSPREINRRWHDNIQPQLERFYLEKIEESE